MKLLSLSLLLLTSSAFAASPNDTVIIAPSTAAITDAAGNLWTIVGSQVEVGGVADTTTAGVKELAYVNGLVWQENTAGNWYSKASPTAAWSAGTTVSPLSASAVLSWAAPTTNTDGSAITGAITYSVYQFVQGQTPALLQSGLSALTLTVTGTPGTTQCWEVTATVAAIPSAFSNAACKAFAAPVLTPSAPVLTVQ